MFGLPASRAPLCLPDLGSAAPTIAERRAETMTLAELLQRAEATLSEKITARQALQDELIAMRSAVETDESITEDKVKAAISARDAADAAVTDAQGKVEELRAEVAREAEIDRLAREVNPTGAQRAHRAPAVVTSQPRTYAREADPAWDSRSERLRRGAAAGRTFLRDVAAAGMGDWGAMRRLDQHMQEERAEREGLDSYLSRAVGTGAFAGLVIPQYLTDEYMPAIQAGRPFADTMRKLNLPATGNTVSIGRITTGTSVADQAAEGDLLSEQNIDDTLLTVTIRTAGGRQTMSRQSIERGEGSEDVTIEDLMGRYAVNLDSNVLNAAVSGMTNVATAVTYTDASPTAAELYPKLIGGISGVASALLGQFSGRALATMTEARWQWLQSQLTSTWPMFGQPGIGAQQGGVNYGEVYGAGFRGLLPNGTAVIADNNIATNLGGGTEDEIYITDPRHCLLWEDANAPLLIRSEQAKAENLQVVLVVYGYYAFTHSRAPHARKISGTGLVTPTF